MTESQASRNQAADHDGGAYRVGVDTATTRTIGRRPLHLPLLDVWRRVSMLRRRDVDLFSWRFDRRWL